MKKWNKVIFGWGEKREGFDLVEDKAFMVTNVPIRFNGEDCGFYRLRYMCINNTYPDDRKIEITTHFVDDRCVATATAWNPLISEKIQKILRYTVIHPNNSGHSTHVGRLWPNEEFCNGALRLAREIFTEFGIADPKGGILTSFALCQETFIKREGRWISLQDVLRIRHKLPGRSNVHEPWPG
jgi:hypothetical protein